MSLIYKRKANQPSLTHVLYDYHGEIAAFVRRIDRKLLVVPMVVLKTIEWSIYRWYQTPIRRFYGVRGNELIYMITRRCTDRCSKCGIWKTPEADAEHLPVSHFINCLKRLRDNLYQVTLTGGEPLIFMDDVLQIGQEARKHELPMVTVTNGVLLTEGFLTRYAKLEHILVISLDTMDTRQWGEFRGRSHYDKVMRNIRLARRHLGDRLRIQSVLAEETQEAVPRVKAFCDDLKISHVVQPYMDFGGSWHGATTSEKTDVACAARKNICICPNGDVVKCFDHRRIPVAEEPLGNIAREDIISILCTKRATEVSRLMKGCNLPCKQLACNVPRPVYNQ